MNDHPGEKQALEMRCNQGRVPTKKKGDILHYG
jgi:hypothetical protein